MAPRRSTRLTSTPKAPLITKRSSSSDLSDLESNSDDPIETALPPPKPKKSKKGSTVSADLPGSTPSTKSTKSKKASIVSVDIPYSTGKPKSTKKIPRAPQSDDDSDYDPAPGKSAPSKRPRTRASLPTIKTESADYPDTERGGVAAVEVYQTMELRCRIFNLVDQDTLAGMLRLEKAATASVAEILYRTIPISIISRMARGTPRRVTYCDAVRHLDINSVDFAPKSRYRRRRVESPVAFHPDLLSGLSTWQAKFPQLQTILRDRPLSTKDESFVVHLSDGKKVVDIETPYQLRITPFPTTGTPSLPLTPTFPGYEVRHTVSLTVSGGYQQGGYDHVGRRQLKAIPDPTLGAWRNWLFCDSTLDPRITFIQIDKSPIELSVEEVITFITSRRSDPQSIVRFAMPSVAEMTIDQLRQVVACIGPDLRTLHFHSSTINFINDWPAVIALLDNSFPSLETLVVSSLYDAISEKPAAIASIPPSALLSGLPFLRVFRFPSTNTVSDDALVLARSLYRLGSSKTTFKGSGQYGEIQTNGFNRLILRLKSSLPQYASLHSLLAADLDLTSVSELSENLFEPVNNQFQRVAWKTTVTCADQVAAAQEKFDATVIRQQAAVQAYQQTLQRTTQSLVDAGEDKEAEKEIIRREFEKVVKENQGMATACRETKQIAADMEAKSRSMFSYAQNWLQANKVND